MDTFSDKKIIQKLQSDKVLDQNEVIAYLYNQLKIKIWNHLRRRGGLKTDVDDLIQEGLIVLFKLAKQNKLEKVRNIQSYLFIVCKNLWTRQQSKNLKQVQIEHVSHELREDQTVLHHLVEKERKEVIAKLIGKLGEECKELLFLFYYERLSFKEIGQQLGALKEATLKTRKSRCLKKLREILSKSPKLKQLLS